MTDFEALKQAGAVAFSDDGCPVSTAYLMAEAMKCAAGLGMPVLAHCEDKTLTRGGLIHEGAVSKALGVPGVPAAAEDAGTARELALSLSTGAPVHICHVSHPMVAQVVKDAIHEGLPITAETCPHYLGFTEDFVFEKGAPAKCTPPMRDKEAMEKLWDYVLDGTLSCVGSDHSPAADEEKDNATKDIWHAWGGLNSIQFFLPMMFDMVVNKKGLSPSLIAKVMDYNPAKIFGLYGRKGAFELGFDGDIVIVDPEKAWKCDQTKLLTKGHVSCFDGLEGKGAPVCTVIRGKVVADGETYKEDAIGYGEYITPVK